MERRVRRIYEEVEEPQPDVLVFYNAVEPHLDPSFFYVTDLMGGGLFERSVALAWPDGRVEMVTSPLEEPSAKGGDVDELTVLERPSERDAYLADRLAGLDRVGMNGNEVVLSCVEDVREAAPDAQVVDVSEAVAQARLVKDDGELERMQRAADIASDVARALPELLEPGIRETELAAEINYRLQKLGASGPSFDTIVAFAEGSAVPHYHAGEVELEEGVFALHDFGARVNRYASDITRTFVVGDASDELQGIYETVLAAQEAGLDAMEPGVPGGTAHEAAEAVIDASKWEGRFIHSLGHSLGLAVHDGASLHPRDGTVLEEGQVWTVEPGIYVPGLGGVRIEDDVVVTANGVRSLTDAPKTWDFANIT